MSNILFYTMIFCYIILQVNTKKYSDSEKPNWAKKDIRDYSDADLEMLLDQWEEDEEPLEPDELPEHLRPQPSIDFNRLNMNDPENLLSATKKGRTLMTFVTVSGKPAREETEELTKLWQTNLWNSHVQVERYLVDDNRAIFLFKDGALAWQAKEHLIEQERCESVTIEGQVYPGKYATKPAQKLSDEL